MVNQRDEWPGIGIDLKGDAECRGEGTRVVPAAVAAVASGRRDRNRENGERTHRSIMQSGKLKKCENYEKIQQHFARKNLHAGRLDRETGNVEKSHREGHAAGHDTNICEKYGKEWK